jgi:hypothetical protein
VKKPRSDNPASYSKIRAVYIHGGPDFISAGVSGSLGITDGQKAKTACPLHGFVV